MDENNIFDDDDALDYILYEDSERNIPHSDKRGGCFILILFLIVPSGLLGALVSYL